YAFRAADLAAGPVWSRKVGTTGGLAAGVGSCLASAIWDYTHKRLIFGSNTKTVNGTSAPRAGRCRNTQTGRVAWVTPVAGGPIMGSPTLSGGGLIAAGTFNNSTP